MVSCLHLHRWRGTTRYPGCLLLARAFVQSTAGRAPRRSRSLETRVQCEPRWNGLGRRCRADLASAPVGPHNTEKAIAIVIPWAASAAAWAAAWIRGSGGSRSSERRAPTLRTGPLARSAETRLGNSVYLPPPACPLSEAWAGEVVARLLTTHNSPGPTAEAAEAGGSEVGRAGRRPTPGCGEQ